MPASIAKSALDHPDLVMPPDGLPPGPARDIRRAMARFRDGDAHLAARSAVERTIATLDGDVVAAIADRRTRAFVDEGRSEQVAAVVPAASVAEALGLLDPDDTGEALVGLLTVVGNAAVTGRVDDDGAVANRAAESLLARAHEQADAIASISIMHQARGATAGLIEGLVAGGETRPSAVPATRRTGATRTVLGGFGPIDQGETVAIELDRATEFGHGRHACPGEALAFAIADTIVEILER